MRWACACGCKKWGTGACACGVTKMCAMCVQVRAGADENPRTLKVCPKVSRLDILICVFTNIICLKRYIWNRLVRKTRIFNFFLVRLLNPCWSAFILLPFKWSNILRIGAISNFFEHFQIFLINWSQFLALQLLAYSFTLFMVQFIKIIAIEFLSFEFAILAKLTSFDLLIFFVKKNYKIAKIVIWQKIHFALYFQC